MTEALRPKNLSEEEVFAVEELIFDVQYEIQKLLSSRKLTQKDLAERMGCSPARISQLLNDKGRNMTLETAARALFALDAKCDFAKAIVNEREGSGRSRAKSAKHETDQAPPPWEYSLSAEREETAPKSTLTFAHILSRKDRGYFVEAANSNEPVKPTKRTIQAA